MLTQLTLTALVVVGITVAAPKRERDYLPYCEVHQWVPDRNSRGDLDWRRPILQHMHVPCREWDNFRKTEVEA